MGWLGTMRCSPIKVLQILLIGSICAGVYVRFSDDGEASEVRARLNRKLHHCFDCTHSSPAFLYLETQRHTLRILRRTCPIHAPTYASPPAAVR